MFKVTKIYDHVVITYNNESIIALTPWNMDLKRCNYEGYRCYNYKIVGIDDV